VAAVRVVGARVAEAPTEATTAAAAAAAVGGASCGGIGDDVGGGDEVSRLDST
jgi:hypothetical protein